jgi:hypothetical protein
MDIRFSCAKGHSLAVDPELAGRRVKCPVCREIVTAPAQARFPAEEEADDDEEAAEELSARRRRPRRTPPEEHEGRGRRHEPGQRARPSKEDQLGWVKFGLNFHLWKYVCFVFAMLLGIMGRVLAAGVPLLALPVVAGAGLSAFAATILGIVGSVFCGRVPPRSGARVLILVSLGFDAAALAALLLAVPAALVNVGLLLLLQLLSLVGGLTGFVLFMVFLKKLAYYLRDRPDGDEAIAAMIQALAVLIGGPVVIVLSAFILVRIPVLGVLLLIAEYVGWLVLLMLTLLRLLTVIKEIRSAI